MGIDELFRLADENSKSIQMHQTGKEAADEALKTAEASRHKHFCISQLPWQWATLGSKLHKLPKYQHAPLRQQILH